MRDTLHQLISIKCIMQSWWKAGCCQPSLVPLQYLHCLRYTHVGALGLNISADSLSCFHLIHICNRAGYIYGAILFVWMDNILWWKQNHIQRRDRLLIEYRAVKHGRSSPRNLITIFKINPAPFFLLQFENLYTLKNNFLGIRYATGYKFHKKAGILLG